MVATRSSRAASLQRIHPGRRRGFTYLSLLAAIAILGIGLLAVAEVWANSARRQKLAQLEWVGKQFAQAIGSYYEATPGPMKRYPNDLADLVEDRRSLTLRRHLRKLYANPFTGQPDWEMLRAADGRIRGVRAAVPEDQGNSVLEFTYRPEIPR